MTRVRPQIWPASPGVVGGYPRGLHGGLASNLEKKCEMSDLQQSPPRRSSD